MTVRTLDQRQAAAPRAADHLLRNTSVLILLSLFLKGVYLLVFFYGFTELFSRLAAPWTRVTGTDGGWLRAVPYHGSSILAGSLANPIVAVTFAIFCVAPFLRMRHLRWANLSNGVWLRWFGGGLALLLAWVLTSYDMNLYLGRAHYLDRVAVIALAVLTVWHPAFMAALLASGFLVLSQFSYPMGDLSLTDAMPLFDTALVLVGLVLVRCVSALWPRVRATGGFDGAAFMLAVLTLHAANYFAPAVEKVAISPHLYEWMLTNDVAMHTRAVLAWGWGPFAAAGPDVHGYLLDGAVLGRLPIQFGTMLLEGAGLFLLLRRRSSIGLLVIWCAFHAIIFMMSGILFWKWMLLNLGLAAVLWRADPAMLGRLFTRAAFHFSLGAALALVAVSYLPIVGPQRLGWFDTPSFNTFRVEVVGASGRTYSVDDDDMTPYDHYFAFDRFFFLVPDKLVIRANASKDYATADRVRRAGIDGIASLKQREGRIYYDADREQLLANFLTTYFRNLNAGMPKKTLLSYVQPPHHLVTSVPGERYSRQEPVSRVRIRFTEYYFDGSAVRTVIDKYVLDIGI